MAIRINYNPMSVLTNANLTRTDRLMTTVLDRMSSGERIRRSADDPAAMVVANSVRYVRRGIDRAGSNAEEAVAMLQTAEAGMDQITEVLQRIRKLAIAASSTATQDPAQLTALQQDLDQALGAITTIAKTTSFGNVQLLDGSLADATLSDDAKDYWQSLKADHTALPGGMQEGSQIGLGAVSGPLDRTYQEEAYGLGTPGDTPVGGPGTMTIIGPKGTSVLAVPAGATIDTVVTIINAGSGNSGVIAAYDEASGIMRLESTSYGSGAISATSDVGGLLVSGPVLGSDQFMQMTYVDAAGNPQVVDLTQDPTSPGGLTFTNLLGGPEPVAPFTGYQPGAFSLAMVDRGTGQVGSTISAPPGGLTATRTSTTAFQLGGLSSQRVVVDIADLRAGALGHSAGLASSGFASLQDLISTQALVNGQSGEALRLIDAALNEVNQARGKSGSLQGSTVERVMDSMRVTGDNLRQYESILRDYDMAEGSAEYARSQVMLQAATAMLAQANQVPQTLLQLLK